MKQFISFSIIVSLLLLSNMCNAQQNQILCYHYYKAIDHRNGMEKEMDHYVYIHFYGQWAYFTDIIDGKEVEKSASQINLSIMKKMETTRDGTDVYYVGMRINTGFTDSFSPYPSNMLLSGTLKVSKDRRLINFTEGYVNTTDIGELVDRPIVKPSMIR